MRSTRILARWLVPAATLLLQAPAHAGPPAAPAVSIHAAVKQLQFSWNRVPGATRYELWFLPGTGGTWVKYAELPRHRSSLGVNISGHFILWNQARYVLKACNAAGCGGSAQLGVSHLMQRTVGVFTSPDTSPGRHLGWDTDISEDGGTLAAAMDVDEAGGVQVFRKSSAGWTLEATLLGDPKQMDIAHGPDLSVAISGDGNVIALGVDSELPPGVDPQGDGYPNIGAVYLFRRTGAGWVREQKLSFPGSPLEDAFGRRVDLDESGTLLAAWRRFGDPPYQAPHPSSHQGHVQLFRYTAGSWTPQATILAANDQCVAMALSGDGNTLMRTCGEHVEVFTAPTWQRVARLPHEVFGMSEFSTDVRKMAVSYDGRSFAVRSVVMDWGEWVANAVVNVYRLGASGWTREATLAPGPWTDPGRWRIPAPPMASE